MSALVLSVRLTLKLETQMGTKLMIAVLLNSTVFLMCFTLGGVA